MAQYASYTGYASGGGGGTVTNVTASSPLASSGGATPNISLTGTVAIANGGSGQVTANAALNAFLPAQAGNANKVLGTDGANTSWVSNSTTPTGTPSTFAGFDALGDLYTVPGFTINTTSGGMDEALTIQPNDLTGFTANSYSINFDPLQNSPNENWNIQSISAFFDINSSGFTQGTAGNVSQLLNLNYTHQGTGDIGQPVYLNLNSNFGNGTDPIDIKGVAWLAAGGNFNNNVSLSGTLQGIVFNPGLNAGTTTSGVQAFGDFCQIPGTVDNYYSASFSPTIGTLATGGNFNGLNVSPNITTLAGTSSFNGVSVNALLGTTTDGNITGFSIGTNVTTMGTNSGRFDYGSYGTITTMGSNSTFKGFNFAPTITTAHGLLYPISITPQIAGGDGQFKGIEIAPSMSGGTMSDVRGLSITLNSMVSSQSQGKVGLESDSRISVNATTTLESAQTFQIGSRLEHLYNVPSGSPVTGTDCLAVNIAGDLTAQDDIALGPIGLGVASVGFIASMGIAATKTVDAVTVFLPAASFQDPGFATGGNITDMYMVRVLPPLPQGATASITNLYGLKIDDFGVTFSGSATNAWGIYVTDTALNNFIGGSLGIGAGTSVPNATLQVAGNMTQGTGNTAAGAQASAFGSSNTASGDQSHAQNRSNTASGPQSSAMGDGCVSSGYAALAGGASTLSSADRSFAFGNTVQAIENNSVAFGRSSNAGVTGIASGNTAFHMGQDCVASGNNSQSLGKGTTSASDQGMAVGEYNIPVGTPGAPASTDELFAVGNGTGVGTENTAFAVLRNGSFNLDGSVGSAGQVLVSGGAGAPVAWATNISGNAANVTGTVAIANGGTGQTTASAAFNALSPMTTGGDIIYGGASGAGTRLANGSSGQVLTSNGGTNAPSWQAVTAQVSVAFISEEQTSGTDGGTFTSGAWQTRVLNTLSDPSSIVTSLSSNQFVLPAGTYEISVTAPAVLVDSHKAKLRNTTDASDTLIGSSEYTSSSSPIATSSLIEGVFTIAGSKTFEIQHQCSTTRATNGFGAASSFSVNEVYTQIRISKIA